MSSMGVVFVGDVGTPIELTVRAGAGGVLSLVGATIKEIVLLAPGAEPGTGVARTASFVTDGSDGRLTYSTIAGDLHTAGTWKVQGRIALGGADFRTSVATFQVQERL